MGDSLLSDLWAQLAAATRGRPASDRDLVKARRELDLFGLPYELCLIPQRGERRDIPGRARPAFGPNPGPRIREEEAFWSRDGLVATPNRFPFFWPQLLLWPEHGLGREPPEGFLAACFGLADELGASVLCNTIGASASIPLSHAHLLDRPSRALAKLALVEVEAGAEASVAAPALDADVPGFMAVIEAEDPARRARIAAALLGARRTAAVNVVAGAGRCHIVPRRAELAAPDFPFAIGCGELFGRFVYPDRARFEAADTARLETALQRVLVDNTSSEHESLKALLGTCNALL